MGPSAVELWVVLLITKATLFCRGCSSSVCQLGCRGCCSEHRGGASKWLARAFSRTFVCGHWLGKTPSGSPVSAPDPSRAIYLQVLPRIGSENTPQTAPHRHTNCRVSAVSQSHCRGLFGVLPFPPALCESASLSCQDRAGCDAVPSKRADTTSSMVKYAGTTARPDCTPGHRTAPPRSKHAARYPCRSTLQSKSRRPQLAQNRSTGSVWQLANNPRRPTSWSPGTCAHLTALSRGALPNIGSATVCTVLHCQVTTTPSAREKECALASMQSTRRCASPPQTPEGSATSP